MFKRYTRRSLRADDGFGSIELLVAITVTALGIALASGLMLAGRSHVRQQEKELEASHAGRASLETILRELRLGGACLPETGEFIALEAINSGTHDEITTRFGLTFDNDMSCIQTATTSDATAGSTTIALDNADGFAAGTLVYLRHTNGSGEYFIVTTVDPSSRTLGTDRGLLNDYPATSGVYAIDERKFSIETPSGAPPRLMLQVGRGLAYPFALGIESLDVHYELADGSIIDEPGDDPTWRSLRQIHIDLTARSLSKSLQGDYIRRVFSVGIKPRNLIGS